jgi:plastocyanin
VGNRTLPRPSLLLIAAAVTAGVAVAAPSVRADDPSFSITIRDHKFEPAEIEVPANAKVRLQVRNADSTPEEFDSSALHREKVIPGGQQAVITIGPLKPGRYEFKGEFHEETARGAVIAK